MGSDTSPARGRFSRLLRRMRDGYVQCRFSGPWDDPAVAKSQPHGAPPIPVAARVTIALRRLVARDPADPRWARPALWAVVVLASVLLLWQLDISGYANEYYAAAAQAASQSWSALFFGAFDAGGFITVDKPPASLWLMGLSVRLFGLSPWSILLPQAICGIATVLVLYLAVRRSFGAPSGVIAALVLALTPVAVLIFRFDNPDALLTLLLVSAAWATIRAIAGGRTRWLILAGVLVGFAFLTKYLQAFIVLPAFGLTFLIAAPGGLRRRAVGLLVAGATVILASGWWVLAVEAIPAGMRPHIGGSAKDSVLDLLLGYDGLGRIFGALGPGGGGGGSSSASASFGVPGSPGFPGGEPGPGFGGAAGLLRMFNEQWGGQIAWLLPAAAVAAVAGTVAAWRAPRTDPARTGFILWGIWLLAHVATFSLASGVVHPYYAVAIAPAVAALVGGGFAAWWRIRGAHPIADAVLASTVLVTAAVAYALLGRTPDFLPWLPALVVALAAVAAGLLLAASWTRWSRRAALAGAVLALVAITLAPASYAVVTTTRAYGTGDASAGPPVAGSQGRSSPPGGFGVPDEPDGSGGRGGSDTRGGFGGRGGSVAPGPQNGPLASVDGGSDGTGAGAAANPLVAYLLANRGSARWIVAVESANAAAPIQLVTGAPVMAMGGFTGSDLFPTADELASIVASGDLRFVLVADMGGRGVVPGSSSGPDRIAWVQESCTTVDYGAQGWSLYDCASARTTGG